MKSIFTDKKITPTEAQLKTALGETYDHWQALANYTLSLHAEAKTLWHYSGEKFGWSFRISDAKRVLKVAFVFGQKATDAVLKSDIADSIKNELMAAKPYAEGRGIRIPVTNESQINDIKRLITIKISN